ncbi:hypothetical protein H6F76_12030 [Leptolyngbya sp. FACHB-321]|uniref:hypothetical protein n=1 Tax=Leptolyngbya sp. FACHB-321 TaxID=2692807 RepID=UPI001686B13A|nr:hypothetical protein [Leptolyngbya sp. FACHB-321]MBD2035748.1 hypothetical protein [Leptolyngbya sp. FACHB-321]
MTGLNVGWSGKPSYHCPTSLDGGSAIEELIKMAIVRLTPLVASASWIVIQHKILLFRNCPSRASGVTATARSTSSLSNRFAHNA